MTFTRPPLSTTRHLIFPEILSTVLIACSPARPWLFLGLVLRAFISFSGLLRTTGDPFQDYFIGNTIMSQLLTVIALSWFTDPIRDYHRDGEAVPTTELPLLQRIYWAVCVKYNLRGIGSNYQVAHIPPPPIYTRWSFVLSRLFRAVQLFLLVDIAEAYIYCNPLFSQHRDNPLPITAQGYFLCCISIIAHGMKPYGLLNFQHSVLSAASVGVGYSEPREWPELFRSLGDAYTVRRFWGGTWHQLMRRFLTILGKSTARFLHAKPHTSLFFFIELYTAFLFSGIIHAAGDGMMNPQYLGISLPFFLYQAIAITFEYIVVASVKKSGIRVSGLVARCVGYGWVILWFSVSMPAFFNLLVESGLSQSPTFPLSPSKALLGALEKQTGVDIRSSLFP